MQAGQIAGGIPQHRLAVRLDRPEHFALGVGHELVWCIADMRQ